MIVYRRSLFLFALAVGVLLLTLGIVYDPAARVQGWLGGEPFFAGRSATAWERDLESTDAELRTKTITALAAEGDEATPVCVWVLQKSTKPKARFAAAESLGRIKSPSLPVKAALVATTADADGMVREVAIHAVARLAPDVPGAVAALMAQFPKDSAIYAVGEFRAAGAEAVPALIELLRHENHLVRWNSARTLGRIGEPALPAVSGLLPLLESDAEPIVREYAAEALGGIGPKATANANVVPALAKSLTYPDQRVRRAAVRSLGSFGPNAKSALVTVKSLQEDPSEDVRRAAAEAAKAIEAAPRP